MKGENDVAIIRNYVRKLLIINRVPIYSTDDERKMRNMIEQQLYEEHRIVLRSLIRLKNNLIEQGRYTDCVDELLEKVFSAPRKFI